MYILDVLKRNNLIRGATTSTDEGSARNSSRDSEFSEDPDGFWNEIPNLLTRTRKPLQPINE